MNSTVLISIIVRTQGRRPRLLARALASLEAQTWPNLEIVVVEDGGDTLAEAVAARNASNGPKFVHSAIASSGRCAAGNAGLARATGTLIGFLDEDDELYPDHLEQLAAALETDPNTPIAYARAHEISCRKLFQDNVEDERLVRIVGDTPFSRARLWQRNSFPIQAALFRRDLHILHGGFDESLDALEDWDLWIRYTANNEVLTLDAITSLYRIPAERQAQTARAKSHQASYARLRAKHRNLTGVLRFEDVNTMSDRVRSEIPFRHALSIAHRAFWFRLRELLNRMTHRNHS